LRLRPGRGEGGRDGGREGGKEERNDEENSNRIIERGGRRRLRLGHTNYILKDKEGREGGTEGGR
jgi:hypothetical protein